MTTEDSTIPRLITERLVLREWRESDRVPYAALNGDAEVMRHFPSRLTPEQSSQMVDRIMLGWREHGFGLWAVERIDTGDFIGFVGLLSPVWDAEFTPCVEIGWRLARAHWGNGFAPEAAATVLDWAFINVPLPGDRVLSFTTVANVNSQRVMQKIGMIRDADGDFDHPLLPDWKDRRHVLYRIDREQYDKRVAP